LWIYKTNSRGGESFLQNEFAGAAIRGRTMRVRFYKTNSRGRDRFTKRIRRAAGGSHRIDGGLADIQFSKIRTEIFG
jgi:hypothetical protein